MGSDTLRNDELLDAAEAAGFDVLLATDRNIRFQQLAESANQSSHRDCTHNIYTHFDARCWSCNGYTLPSQRNSIATAKDDPYSPR
ncbi:MAG: hypothetical protein ACRD15_18925, partial [Vicinamibacterales bacterium]